MHVPGSYDDDEEDLNHLGTSSRTPLLSSSSSSAPLLPFPVTTTASASYPPAPRRSTAVEKLAASKDKGKGRAQPQDDEESRVESNGGGGPAGMNFSFRFTDGGGDLVDVWVGERESVGEVKRRIRLLRPSLNLDGRPRRLRLIQLGRLLTDGTFLVPYTVQLLSRRAKLVKQQTQPQAEALLEGLEEAIGVRRSEDEKNDSSGKGKEKEKIKDGLEGTEAEEDKRVWLHCSVGEVIEEEEEKSGVEEKDQSAQITPLQGLDRLRDAGFSEEEITSMRAEFRRTAAASTPVDGDEDEHARALEDQWMEGLTGQNEAAGETNSSDGYWLTILQGVCIGFFIPFLPLFFFRVNVFSRHMQMAIILGCVINIGFAVLRVFSV